MNTVNKKALSRKHIPILKAPLIMNSLENRKSERLSSVLFSWKKTQNKPVTSKRECSQPAALAWTVSSSAVLDMLNSFQLTQAEETHYEITTEIRIQHSVQK